MDYRKLLQNGVEGIRQQLAAAKAALQPQDPEYAEKLAFYQAEEELCQGMLALAQRYAATGIVDHGGGIGPCPSQARLFVPGSCSNSLADADDSSDRIQRFFHYTRQI